MSGPPPPRRPPGKRDLKATILWCARYLVGEGDLHAGKVRVEIVASDAGEALTVKPVKGCDGLTPPPASLAGERAPTGDDVPRSELLRVLLSDDERAVLRVLADRGPCRAKDVSEAVRARITESSFWVVWKQLQVRGLVQEEDDGRFAVGVEWVRGLVGGEGGTGKPAA